MKNIVWIIYVALVLNLIHHSMMQDKRKKEGNDFMPLYVYNRKTATRCWMISIVGIIVFNTINAFVVQIPEPYFQIGISGCVVGIFIGCIFFMKGNVE